MTTVTIEPAQRTAANVAGFIYLIAMALYGNPDWGASFSAYLGLALIGASFTAFGLLTSAVVTPPNDGFYTPVNYIGAFKNLNWASDWGFAAEAGVITYLAAGSPLPSVSVAALPNPVSLSVALNGANLDITFPSQTGYHYQLQTRLDLSSGSWADTGSPESGTGGPLTISLPISGNIGFYQVRAY